MNNIDIITSLILPTLYFVYASRKDLAKHSDRFCNSKIGKNILRFIVSGGFIFFIFVDLFIFAMTLLKHEFSVNGFYIGFALFLFLLSITAGYFYFTFKDLFFPKNTTNQKPFTIV